MRASRANLVFWLAWLSLAVWCYHNSADDPSSIFYNPAKAYRLRFSTVRTSEVDRFLRQTNVTAPGTRQGPPQLCVGIPSINRTTESFLEHTVGSLVDGLTADERALVHIVVLLADRTPQTHAAYGQEWLGRLVDEVVVYADRLAANATLPAANYHAIPFDVRGEPRGDGRVENMRLDHSVLVERCRGQEAPYFAFVEDDVIATRSWFAKFRSAVGHVERETERSGRDWIYLRLFYSELLMGWNAEESLHYAAGVVAAYTVLLLLFLELRRRHKIGPTAKGATQNFNHAAALVFCLWTPAVIALFFMAGRVSTHRLSPFPLSGVREMPNYGCCAQGLVFPNRHLDGFQRLLRDPPFAFAGDQILEDYARDHGLRKWALDPSVLQHAGQRESSDGPRKADVWNFSFERLHE
ncbi:hypothetical protein RJ55_02383 [Drechmeria coniospora]|nr:hypothetical protein RJ55_02383 [Drechmeria coniospora]